MVSILLGRCLEVILLGQMVDSAKLWNQPRCPSTDEWITKLWNIYTMEFYAVIKKNKIMSFVGKWMELESIMA